MALLSLDRHDVLETIRQSNSLHEAFLRVAKLPAVGEYRTATNADRIRSISDEELAEELWAWNQVCCYKWTKDKILKWLKEEAEDGGT